MGFDRVLAELVGSVRRAGLDVSPVEAIDVQKAAVAIGLSRRDDLKAALRAVVVKDDRLRARFDRAFDAFFDARGAAQGSLFDRLRSQGFADVEVQALEELLDAMAQAQGGGTSIGGVAAGGGELDRLLFLAGRDAGIDRMQSPMQAGFYTSRLLESGGFGRMQTELAAVRERLRDALGARADAIADAVAAELEGFRRVAREHVVAAFERSNAALYEQARRERLEDRAFSSLSLDEAEQVEREVRRLAEKLRGRQSLRRKRRRRGQLDLRRTLRRSHATGGLPFSPVFRKRRRDRPKLVILCDVSDSVRFAAKFLLVFVFSVQEIFAQTRTFVFVSDVGETTEVFKAHPVGRAIQIAYGGGVVNVAANSNYGRAFGEFVERFPAAVDRRTTVLVVGDARTNYHEPNERALARLRERAGRILWFNPEPRGAWGFGDSVMDVYASHCHEVRTVHDLGTLREAVDRLVRVAG